MHTVAARSALVLFALLAVVGCGGGEVKKTEDPAVIEQLRQKSIQDSQREMTGK
jgi:hypothetical protein